MQVLISGLAAWRLAHLLMYESGPWNLMLRIRASAGIRHDASGGVESYPDGFIGKLFSCMFCMSIWTSVFAWRFALNPPVQGGFETRFHGLNQVLATSAVAIIVDGLYERWS